MKVDFTTSIYPCHKCGKKFMNQFTRDAHLSICEIILPDSDGDISPSTDIAYITVSNGHIVTLDERIMRLEAENKELRAMIEAMQAGK